MAASPEPIDPHGHVHPHESIEPPCPIEPHWAELSDVVAQAERNRAAMALLHAERAELCAAALRLVEQRVAQRRAAGVGRGEPIGDAIPLREVTAELSTALRVSEQTVQRWLGDGAALVSTFPATLAALRSGRIDERHASAIIDAGSALTDDDVRAHYETIVLAIAEQATAPALRHHAEVVAARLQPELAETRQRQAHERRRVRVFDLEAGLSRMLADLPTTIAHAVFDRLTQMADALDEDGDEDVDEEAAEHAGIADAATSASADATEAKLCDGRSMDQRRADVLCDLLLCASPTGHGDPDALGAIRGTVQVTIPVLTLAGIGGEPALLAGHGPIDAATARRLAAQAPGWDRVLTHPHTGEPLAVDRYRPSSQIRRYLEARDEQCRWPGCRRSAGRCDADHTIAHADGGQTTVANLTLFCRAHHVLKHASPWQIRQLGGGALEFISPTGRRYRNDAPPVVHFVPLRQPWNIPRDPGDPPPF